MGDKTAGTHTHTVGIRETLTVRRLVCFTYLFNSS